MKRKDVYKWFDICEQERLRHFHGPFTRQEAKLKLLELDLNRLELQYLADEVDEEMRVR